MSYNSKTTGVSQAGFDKGVRSFIKKERRKIRLKRRASSRFAFLGMGKKK